MKWRAEHRVCELRSTSAAQVPGLRPQRPANLSSLLPAKVAGVSTRPVELRYTRTTGRCSRKISRDTSRWIRSYDSTSGSRSGVLVLRIIYDAFLGAEAMMARWTSGGVDLGSTD